MQEMVIYGVSFDMVGKQPIVLLKTVDGNRFLPIWIGHAEASAILMADGAKKRRAVAKQACEQGLSVRATEALARAVAEGTPSTGRPRRAAPGIADEAIDAFAGAFEASVTVRSASKGRVVVQIAFADEAAVAAAIDRLDRPE